MVTDKQAFGLAAVIFTLVAALHAIRLIRGWEAVIGGWAVPIWLSWVGIVLAGYLAYHFWKLVRK